MATEDSSITGSQLDDDKDRNDTLGKYRRERLAREIKKIKSRRGYLQSEYTNEEAREIEQGLIDGEMATWGLGGEPKASTTATTKPIKKGKDAEYIELTIEARYVCNCDAKWVQKFEVSQWKQKNREKAAELVRTYGTGKLFDECIATLIWTDRMKEFEARKAHAFPAIASIQARMTFPEYYYTLWKCSEIGCSDTEENYPRISGWTHTRDLMISGVLRIVTVKAMHNNDDTRGAKATRGGSDRSVVPWGNDLHVDESRWGHWTPRWRRQRGW